MRDVIAATLILVSALVLGVQQPGGAAMMGPSASIKAELKTAIYHSSELAQKAAVMGPVQLHTQHTINCLEGPKGMHFKAAAGFPCQGQGNGIVPDLQAAVQSGVPGARAALGDAQIAWQLALQIQSMSDVNEAQPWAKVVARYLQMASDELGG